MDGIEVSSPRWQGLPGGDVHPHLCGSQGVGGDDSRENHHRATFTLITGKAKIFHSVSYDVSSFMLAALSAQGSAARGITFELSTMPAWKIKQNKTKQKTSKNPPPKTIYKTKEVRELVLMINCILVWHQSWSYTWIYPFIFSTAQKHRRFLSKLLIGHQVHLPPLISCFANALIARNLGAFLTVLEPLECDWLSISLGSLQISCQFTLVYFQSRYSFNFFSLKTSKKNKKVGCFLKQHSKQLNETFLTAWSFSFSLSPP